MLADPRTVELERKVIQLQVALDTEKEKNTRHVAEVERLRERLREVDPEWLAEGEALACAKAQGYTGMTCSCLCHEETGTCETCRRAASDNSTNRQPK